MAFLNPGKFISISRNIREIKIVQKSLLVCLNIDFYHKITSIFKVPSSVENEVLDGAQLQVFSVFTNVFDVELGIA